MRARLLVLLALGAACETHCFSLVGHTPPRPPARPARFARSTFAHLPVGAASPSAARSSRTTTALFVGGEVVSGSGGSRDVGECKQAVLRAVAKGNKDDVLRAARELEQTGIVQKDEIGGRWSLVFSTQTDATAGADGSIPESVFNQVNAVLYRFFFRFAPFLAGSQDRSASPGIPGVATRNEQASPAAPARHARRVRHAACTPPSRPPLLPAAARRPRAHGGRQQGRAAAGPRRPQGAAPPPRPCAPAPDAQPRMHRPLPAADRGRERRASAGLCGRCASASRGSWRGATQRRSASHSRPSPSRSRRAAPRTSRRRSRSRSRARAGALPRRSATATCGSRAAGAAASLCSSGSPRARRRGERARRAATGPGGRTPGWRGRSTRRECKKVCFVCH